MKLNIQTHAAIFLWLQHYIKWKYSGCFVHVSLVILSDTQSLLSPLEFQIISVVWNKAQQQSWESSTLTVKLLLDLCTQVKR